MTADASHPPITPPITWITATIDLPDESFGVGKAFWGAVTGYRPNLPGNSDPNYATLQPQVGTPHLWLQRLIDGDPSVHLDLHLGAAATGHVDLGEAVAHAQRCGATVHSQGSHAVVLSPAGVPLCLIPDAESTITAPVPAAPTASEHGRSLVDQVCLDIASESWAEEIAFWPALTGWEISADDDWARLWTPDSWPVRILLQRREVGETSAHLDVACDDRAAEVRRWIGLGARVIGEGPRWTIMETPGELVVCLTNRSPDTGRLPGDLLVE